MPDSPWLGGAAARRAGQRKGLSLARLERELVAAPARHDGVSERRVEGENGGICRARVDLPVAIGPRPRMHAHLERSGDATAAVLGENTGDQDAEDVIA